MFREIIYLSSAHYTGGIVFGIEINVKILRDTSSQKTSCVY